jgi:hypothetical protein
VLAKGLLCWPEGRFSRRAASLAGWLAGWLAVREPETRRILDACDGSIQVRAVRETRPVEVPRRAHLEAGELLERERGRAPQRELVLVHGAVGRIQRPAHWSHVDRALVAGELDARQVARSLAHATESARVIDLAVSHNGTRQLHD